MLRKTLVALPFFLLSIHFIFGPITGLTDGPVTSCLFLAAWMVSWWILEILPLGITALIPLFYLPVLQVMKLKAVTPAYSNPVIFLFLGGFIIARGLEKTKLDERIALSILSKTGRSDNGIVLGFVIATAFLSMWISNTATTVMMVPIALSVTQFLRENLKDSQRKDLPLFNVVLFLSIAYAANVGGIMTPIGTPPNVVFLGFLNDMYNVQVDFSHWLAATAPVALTLLVIMIFLLKKLNPYTLRIPDNFKGFISSKLQGLGKINSPQRVTIFVFLTAAFLWIFKGGIHYLIGSSLLNDTSIAIFAGLLLFLIPTEKGRGPAVLDKKDISHLPWDIVLLFGGGMALANALKEAGLIQQVTDSMATLNLGGPYPLVFLIAGVTLFLTEIMSNVALCVVALPLIMKLGEAQGLDPLLVAMPAALCSSFAFSMPISTPPNAIVFGTNTISVKQMLRAGILLNFVALGLTMTVGYFLIRNILVS